MMRKFVPVLLTIILVFTMSALPLCADAALFIQPESPQEKEVEAGETVSFDWYIFNQYNETIYILAEESIDAPSGVVSESKLKWSGSEYNSSGVELQKGTSTHLHLTLYIDELSDSAEISVNILLTIYDPMNDGWEESETLSASATVKPIHQLSDSYNKILGIWDNPLPTPADTALGAFLISLLIWLVFTAAFFQLMLPWIAKKIMTKRPEYSDMVKKLTRRPIFIAVMSYGFFECLFILGPNYRIGLTIEMVSSIVYILLGAWVAWTLYKILVSRFIDRFRDENGVIDTSLEPLFVWLGEIVLAVSVLAAVLNVFGFDLMVFLAGAGIIGLAISLGAQETLSNFFAGFFLLLERPFRVGDLIQMDDGVICEVKRVGLRSTTLYNTWDPQQFIIPNHQIANSKITNVMRPDPKYFVKINVGVAYGSDIKMVKEILLKAVTEHPETLKDKEHEPWVRFMAFGDSALEFRVTCWVPDFNIHYRVASEIRETIDKEFRKNGIQIPFPQRDIWIRDMPS